jgi:signal transduction histidine kinase
MEAEKTVFMGKITAGVTHEIKNVLAIIKESAGLLEDLITLSKEDSPPPREKLLRTLTRISDQVTRGVDLSTNLNAFAHAADERSASVDLNQAITQAAFLCQRFARLKGMTIDLQPHGGTVPMVTDPLGLQMCLFQCVDLLMGLSEKGTVITLRPEGNNGNRIAITAERSSVMTETACLRVVSEAAQWSAVQTAASKLNLTAYAGGPPLCISLGAVGQEAVG